MHPVLKPFSDHPDLVRVGKPVVVDPVLEFVDPIVDPVPAMGATDVISLSFEIELGVRLVDPPEVEGVFPVFDVF